MANRPVKCICKTEKIKKQHLRQHFFRDWETFGCLACFWGFFGGQRWAGWRFQKSIGKPSAHGLVTIQYWFCDDFVAVFGPVFGLAE